MATFRNSTFVGATVDLDGNTYESCLFQRCIIRFSGLSPAALSNCQFQDCTLALGGHATLTLSYLRALYHGLGEWGKQSVENLFEEIRKPENEISGDES